MKRAILASNPYRDADFHTVRAAAAVLQKAGVEVRHCLPFEVDGECSLPKDIRFFPLEREMQNADVIICFGGDGTILHMAKAAARRGTPILGVNIGTMGFMAELESTELDMLARLATDDYRIDSRMMLDVTIHRRREIVFHDICLNDVVITKGGIARIVYLSVRCDGVQAMEVGGDGIILATPTGSTAYSLSAGGPIVEPETHNIIITPICAHSFANRCIVASEDRVVTVSLAQNAKRSAFLSSDGGKMQRLNMGDIATVRKSTLTTKLVRLKKRSFYDVVNIKFRNNPGGAT